MQTDQTDEARAIETPLPLRSDTMLGACEAIGQDFGFHPNWLRVALGSLVLWSPLMAFVIYLALAGIVGLSRLIAPPHRETVATRVTTHRSNTSEAKDLPLAA